MSTDNSKDKKVCPHCGSETGFFTTISGVQFYDWEGNTNGFNISGGNESKTARCISCEKPIDIKKYRKD